MFEISKRILLILAAMMLLLPPIITVLTAISREIGLLTVIILWLTAVVIVLYVALKIED